VDEAIDALAANTLLEVDPGAAAMAWAGLARARWRAGWRGEPLSAVRPAVLCFPGNHDQSLAADIPMESKSSRVALSSHPDGRHFAPPLMPSVMQFRGGSKQEDRKATKEQ